MRTQLATSWTLWYYNLASLIITCTHTCSVTKRTDLHKQFSNFMVKKLFAKCLHFIGHRRNGIWHCVENFGEMSVKKKLEMTDIRKSINVNKTDHQNITLRCNGMYNRILITSYLNKFLVQKKIKYRCCQCGLVVKTRVFNILIFTKNIKHLQYMICIYTKANYFHIILR